MEDTPTYSHPAAPLAAGAVEEFTPAMVLTHALNRRFGHPEDGPIPWGNMTPKVVHDVALLCLQGVEAQLLDYAARAEKAETRLQAEQAAGAEAEVEKRTLLRELKQARTALHNATR